MQVARQVALILLFGCALLTMIWRSTTRASSLRFSFVEMQSGASPSVVNVGDPLTFTVRISNSSDAQLNDLVIVDRIPPELNAASVHYQVLGGTDISVTTGMNIFTMTMQSLELLGQILITIPGTMQNGLENNRVITNHLDLTGMYQAEVISTSVEVTATALNPDLGADLVIDKSAFSATVDAGATLTYTVVVTNVGGHDTSSILITDTMPNSLLIKGIQLSALGAIGPDLKLSAHGFTATFDSLISAGRVTLLITASLSSQAGNGITLTNQAWVQADEDVDLNNNAAIAVISVHNPNPTATATATFTPTATPTAVLSPTATSSVSPTVTITPIATATASATATPSATSTPSPVVPTSTATNSPSATPTPSVTPTVPTATPTVTSTSTPTRPADLAIAKSANAASVTAGDPVTYTIAIRNQGDVTVTDLIMVDHLPSGMVATYISGTSSAAVDYWLVYASEVATYSAAALGPGGWVKLNLLANVERDVLAGTTLVNQVGLTASNDSNADNNQAAYTITIDTPREQEAQSLYLPLLVR